jgi:hypothetical protein
MCEIYIFRLQDIGKALEGFAGQIRTIAESMPNEPPVPAISERLTQRSSELSRDTDRLRQQMVDAVGVPASQLQAGVANINKRLEGFVKGELCNSLGGGDGGGSCRYGGVW